KNAGVRLTSITEPFDYMEPEGQLMASTFSSFAAYERAAIHRRMAEGKALRARAGYLPQGTAPYGYVVARRQPVQIDPDQAEVVRLIYRLYIDGMSQAKIAEYLSAMGIPSPASQKQDWRLDSDGKWCSFTIAKILTSEYYATGQYKYKPPGKDPIAVPVPSIISPETFQRAREVARFRRQNSPAPGTYREYLLRGLVFCGVCGGNYTGTSHGRGRYFYYRCNKKRKYFECKMPQVPADIVEDICWNGVKELFEDPDRLADEIARILEEEPSKDGLLNELEEIKTARAGIEQEKKRLLDGYAKGLFPESDLQAALAERNQALKVLEQREKYLKNQIRARQETAAALEGICGIADQIKAILENADNATKRDLFLMTIRRVEIHPVESNDKALEIKVFYKIGTSMRNTWSLVK
ncbi:MAG TPA: recombinase family protein, partial [Syntrophothermus lipocalidus]|nr:recombinase family protein [Syntrophothermus lipocalidus]